MKAHSPLSIAPLFWFILVICLCASSCTNKDAHPNAYGAPNLLPCGNYFSYYSPDSSASIFIPSVFSPNRDSINDTLFIYAQGMKRFSFEVYDVNGGGKRVFVRNASGNQTKVPLRWNGNSNEASANLRTILNQRVYQLSLKWIETKDSFRIEKSAYHNVLLLRNSGLGIDSTHKQPLTERDCECAKNGTYPRQVNRDGLIEGATRVEILNCP